jgi:hypothetical protein
LNGNKERRDAVFVCSIGVGAEFQQSLDSDRHLPVDCHVQRRVAGGRPFVEIGMFREKPVKDL